MSIPLASGITGLGFTGLYFNIAKKVSMLSKVPVGIQASAFALVTVAQGIFMYYCYSGEEDFSGKKVFEVLAPYLLIGTAIYGFYRQAFAANIISSFVFGVMQIAAHKIAPNIIDLSLMFKKDLDLQKIIFGREDWDNLGVDVGIAPDIPKEMVKMLGEPSPFHRGQRIGDIGIAVLMPATITVYGKTKRFTFDVWKQLISEFQYKWEYESLAKELSKVEVSKPYWLFITKDCIPGSLNKPYEEQKKLVERVEGYDCPSALEVVTSMLMYYSKHKIHLYGRRPIRMTRCLETVTKEDENCVVEVGGFWPYGKFWPLDDHNLLHVMEINIDVHYACMCHPFTGVSAARKFLT